MPIQALDYPGARLLMDVTSDIEAAYRVKACAKEPWTVAFIERIPAGGVFWDIGANVGSYSLVAASRGLQVVAVEPGYRSYAKHCDNLALNNLLDRALVLCCALAESSGFGWLDYADLRPGAAGHSLGNLRKQGFHRQMVPAWSLDDLLQVTAFPGPRYLKIDVDGTELDVLRGGRSFLADSDTQGVLTEIPLKGETEIVGFLAELGWTMTARFDERDGKKIGNIFYGEFRRA